MVFGVWVECAVLCVYASMRKRVNEGTYNFVGRDNLRDTRGGKSCSKYIA